MRFWRAVGDSCLILLFFVLSLRPLAWIWSRRFNRALNNRRELGIWFGWLALLHSLLILNGWGRWDALRFLGYDFVPQPKRMAQLEPSFSLSNQVNVVAMLITLVLMATSIDWAVRLLGGRAWKFLQLSSYTVFYLVALHTVYLLFLHYTQSFHHQVPEDPNWFRYPFLGLTITLIILQSYAFVFYVKKKRSSSLWLSSASTATSVTGA